jgi:hypothetical protein
LDSVRALIYPVALVIMLTSLIDLFVNRLLFRGGPDVLAHLNFDASGLAIVGRISLNFEQVAVYVIMISICALLLRTRDGIQSILGLSLIPVLFTSGLLYLPLSNTMDWAASTALILFAGISVLGLAYWRLTTSRGIKRNERIAVSALVVTISLGFIFPFYYRLYLLLGSTGVLALPLGLQAYQVGVFAVMVSMIAAFTYSAFTRSGEFRMRTRWWLVALLPPTLLVVPISYGLFRSFFMTQIFAMIIAMGTDIMLSFQLVQLIAVLWWFLLSAIMILFVKGWRSSDRRLILEAVGLVLLMSTTFLFNYPNYVILGILGVLFITHPFSLDKID